MVGEVAAETGRGQGENSFNWGSASPALTLATTTIHDALRRGCGVRVREGQMRRVDVGRVRVQLCRMEKGGQSAAINRQSQQGDTVVVEEAVDPPTELLGTRAGDDDDEGRQRRSGGILGAERRWHPRGLAKKCRREDVGGGADQEPLVVVVLLASSPIPAGDEVLEGGGTKRSAWMTTRSATQSGRVRGNRESEAHPPQRRLQPFSPPRMVSRGRAALEGRGRTRSCSPRPQFS
uniref:Uncharacterized protein n=1 Tax=Oryza sativa subsp. japonica TaxID=39947 RepID=Q6Z458_ORYSJ|nr:hypothetical protein [Oryza sativa Japonica Group]